jgi:hypothetical protein
MDISRTFFAPSSGIVIAFSKVSADAYDASLRHNEPILRLAYDEILSRYAKDVDRSLIRENLRLSYTERLERLQRNVWAAKRLHRAGVRALKEKK